MLPNAGAFSSLNPAWHLDRYPDHPHVGLFSLIEPSLA
jgi:hypothetical protein